MGNYIGQLVKVSSYQKGDQISLSRVTSGGVRGTLDVANRKVGDTELAENVRIYDKVGSGSLVEVKLADVPVKKKQRRKCAVCGEELYRKNQLADSGQCHGRCLCLWTL